MENSDFGMKPGEGPGFGGCGGRRSGGTDGKRTGGGQRIGAGGGLGRNKGGAYGPGGDCICSRCKTKVPHQRGIKCTTVKCPECGHPMIREELLNEKTKK